MREVQSVCVCERERERERERDGSSETEVVRRKWRHYCRAKIGDKFALSLAKNSHLSFPPSHFPSLPSRRDHLYETSKNSIKLIPKTMEIAKETVGEDARVLKNWRKINCWAQIITRRSRYGFWWFVLNNWFFFNFLTPAHPHAQSLFLFPIVFGINLTYSRRSLLTHFVDTHNIMQPFRFEARKHMKLHSGAVKLVLCGRSLDVTAVQQDVQFIRYGTSRRKSESENN